MNSFGHWLLFSRDGQRTLVIVYAVLALASIVTYSIMRGPWYGLGQVALFGFAAWWTYFCLHRARS